MAGGREPDGDEFLVILFTLELRASRAWRHFRLEGCELGSILAVSGERCCVVNRFDECVLPTPMLITSLPSVVEGQDGTGRYSRDGPSVKRRGHSNLS